MSVFRFSSFVFHQNGPSKRKFADISCAPCTGRCTTCRSYQMRLVRHYLRSVPQAVPHFYLLLSPFHAAYLGWPYCHRVVPPFTPPDPSTILNFHTSFSNTSAMFSTAPADRVSSIITRLGALKTGDIANNKIARADALHTARQLVTLL